MHGNFVLILKVKQFPEARLQKPQENTRQVIIKRKLDGSLKKIIIIEQRELQNSKIYTEKNNKQHTISASK